MPEQQLTGGNGVTGQSGEEFRTMCQEMFHELYQSLHPRLHALTSDADHGAVATQDYRKFLSTSSVNGKPILKFLEDNDIPDTIVRVADFLAHLQDFDNPHHVTAEQLGITVIGGIEYIAAPDLGIKVTDVDETTKAIEIDPNNLNKVSTMEDSDVFLVGLGSPTLVPKVISLDQVRTLMGVNAFYRGRVYSAADAYYGVEVMATGPGITATLTGGNIMAIDIPTGVHLLSCKIIHAGYPTLVLKITGDMGNSTPTDRWPPIFQAWNETVGSQLTGATLTLDSFELNKFTVNGLINSGVNNVIRLSF
jgi:hypothetical protein